MKKRFVIFAVVVVILVALPFWPVVRHFQLKARLTKYKNELSAKGEKLLIEQLIPPVNISGPNGQEALLDVMAPLRSLSFSNQPGCMRFVAPGKARVAWQQPVLLGGESTNIWPSLTAEYEKKRNAIKQLAQVIREYNHFDFRPDYRASFNMVLPHLAVIKDVIQHLTAAAVYELHNGNHQQAFEYLMATSELISRLDNEPVFITQLVLIACRQIALGLAWEALQNDAWTEIQWKELQQSWERMQNTALLENTLQMEIAVVCDTYEQVRKNPSLVYSVPGTGSTIPNLINHGRELMEDPHKKLSELRFRIIWPYWTSYREELVCLQHYMVNLEAFRAAVTNNNYLNSLSVQKAKMKELQSTDSRDYSMLFNTDSASSISKKYAYAECARRLAVTAIALKRYHLENKRYPENLPALVPRFVPALPIDYMDGKPLRYQSKQTAKEYLLYSVGEDGVDQGGDFMPADSESKSTVTRYQWQKGRDWVWPQPASAEEVEAFNILFRKQYLKSR